MRLALLGVVVSSLSFGCAAAGALKPCPQGVTTAKRAQGVTDAQRRASHWIDRLPSPVANRVLLSRAQIVALNVRNAQRPWAFQDVTGPEIAAEARVEREIRERVTWLNAKFRTGKYIEGERGMYAAALVIQGRARRVDEIRVMVGRSDLRCIPSLASLRTTRTNTPFDRNQCSALRVGSLVRVLKANAAKGWYYVHAGHSVGWLFRPVWTPPVTRTRARAFRDAGPRWVSRRTGTSLSGGILAPLGGHFPLTPEGRVVAPSRAGFKTYPAPAKGTGQRGWVPFTRAQVFRLAFSELGRGYGWGDRAGRTDCSGFLLDLFNAFGIRLGRHSSDQAKSGSASLDVKGVAPAAKRRRIRRAAKQGVVLLYLPGHIMLYLGEDQGRLYAISSIYEIVRPCPGHQDQEIVLGRTAVTPLDVGLKSRRRAFIDRIRRIAIFGTVL